MGVLARIDMGRLAAVLGMLGSAHDGEALAAARMAERMRRQAGLAWPDLLVGPPRQPDLPLEPPPDWRAMAARCASRPGPLTAWERNFIETVASYRQPPSERQLVVLRRLFAKVARCEP
jgi:hypothetical protein